MIQTHDPGQGTSGTLVLCKKITINVVQYAHGARHYVTIRGAPHELLNLDNARSFDIDAMGKIRNIICIYLAVFMRFLQNF